MRRCRRCSRHRQADRFFAASAWAGRPPSARQGNGWGARHGACGWRARRVPQGKKPRAASHASGRCRVPGAGCRVQGAGCRCRDACGGGGRPAWGTPRADPAPRPSPRGSGSPAVLAAWAHCTTRTTHCVRSPRTGAMDQFTKRASPPPMPLRSSARLQGRPWAHPMPGSVRLALMQGARWSSRKRAADRSERKAMTVQDPRPPGSEREAAGVWTEAAVVPARGAGRCPGNEPA
jgi:hypothetical protein